MPYITVVPPPELVERAFALHRGVQAETGREYLHNSITCGESSPHGMVGELLVPWYYSSLVFERQRCREDVWEYDWWTPLLNRLEIKTKVCTSEPQPDYFSSVADTWRDHRTQNCDWYGFVRVRKDFSAAYLLGFLPKDLFMEQAQYFLKGEVDPTSNGLFLFKENCWNVHTHELIAPPPAAAGFAELPAAAQALREQLFATRHLRAHSIFV